MPALPAGILPAPSNDDVTTLVKRVKLMEMLPSSATTFADADIADLMNQELNATIVPLVQSAREEYMVVTRDYVLPAIPAGQTVNVQNYVDIPSEATGLRLRDVYMIDAYGNFANIPRLNPEQIAAFTASSMWSSNGISSSAGWGGFYLQGTRLFIYPYWSANNRPIRLTFYRRPAQLTLTTGAAQIISIAGTVVTVGPTSTTWSAGSYVDFIRNDPPHDYVSDTSVSQALYTSSTPLQAVPVLEASGGSYVFDASVVQSLSVGDWICTNGYSPFAQFIPYEAAATLCQITSARCLEALGDREGQQLSMQKYDKMAKDLLKMITPRVDGKAKKVTNPNSLSRNNGLYGVKFR